MSVGRVSRPLGLAAGFAAAPCVYALVRVISGRVDSEADPSAVIWAEHSPTVTHLVVTLYIGLVVMGAMMSLASAVPRAMPRTVAVIAVIAALAVAAQAAWVP